MKLTLKPSQSYLVPSTFHTHSIPTPRLPSAQKLKIPVAFVKAKRNLQQTGLLLPNYLAADKALWWQIAIEEVCWDLEDEEVVVSFSDGTEERWDLGGPKSSESIMEEEDEYSQAIGVQERRQASSSSLQGETRRNSRWSSETVLARLRSFAIELRSAYEDITTASLLDPEAPSIEDEGDHSILMALSADPAKQVPFEGSQAESLHDYYMNGDFGDVLRDNEVDEEQQSKRTPSHHQSDDSSEDHPTHGQFKSRRRPTRIPPTYERAPTPPPSNTRNSRQSHDYLSTVHLLTRIREYLADLLPSTIYPKLRQEFPSTYSLWCVDGAIAWCRREAIRKGSEAGEQILDLLDDDAESLLVSSTQASDIELFSESEDSMEVDSEDEGSWGIEIRDGRGRYQAQSWSGYARRETKRSDNPLDSMREDFKLRCWAEDAIERDRALEREQWLKKEEKPRWHTPPEPWEVSIPVDESDSEFEELISEGRGRKGFKNAFSAFSMPRTLTKVPPQPPTSPPQGAFDTNSTPPHLVSPSSSSSDFDPVSDPSSEPDSTTYSDYFYPEDYLEEDFLPRRLPKAVVTPSTSRSRVMEQARAKLHSKLNEIAGLERKMKELHEFASQEEVNWEEDFEEQRRLKEKDLPSDSGLRSPGPSSTSPPPTPRRKGVLPLKAQPLRHQTADRSLTNSLATALRQLEPKAKVRKGTFDTARKASNKRTIIATPKPRKRQKFNLETLDRVTALSIQVREDSKVEKEGGEGEEKQKKKKRKQEQITLSEKVARAIGVREEGNEFKKRKNRKGKAIKREASQIDLTPPRQSIFTSSPLPSTSPPALTADTARRMTLSELAHHRKHPVADLAELPPSLDPDNPFLSPPQEDILVYSEDPSTSFPHMDDDDGELTDEEDTFDENPFILHFDDATGEVEYHDSEMIDSPTPHSSLPPDSALSSIAASQFPSHPRVSPSSSTSPFPTSYTRVEDSSIDPVLRRLSFPSQPPPTPPTSQAIPSEPVMSPYFPTPQLEAPPPKTAESERLSSKMIEKFAMLAGKKNDDDSKSLEPEDPVRAGDDSGFVEVSDLERGETSRGNEAKGEKVE